ncbi:MAG: Fic family protein [Gammaproteobacteria bacterium]
MRSALSQDETQILNLCQEPKFIHELMTEIGWKDRTKFRRKFIEILIKEGLLEMTIPNKFSSRLQKYRTTAKGLKHN